MYHPEHLRLQYFQEQYDKCSTVYRFDYTSTLTMHSIHISWRAWWKCGLIVLVWQSYILFECKYWRVLDTSLIFLWIDIIHTSSSCYYYNTHSVCIHGAHFLHCKADTLAWIQRTFGGFLIAADLEHILITNNFTFCVRVIYPFTTYHSAQRSTLVGLEEVHNAIFTTVCSTEVHITLSTFLVMNCRIC